MEKFNWNYPTSMWVGENRIKDLSIACKNLNVKKPLLVTDKGLAQSTIVKDALSNLKSNNLSTEIFYDVIGNPTGKNVSDGVKHYKEKNCDGVIAIVALVLLLLWRWYVSRVGVILCTMCGGIVIVDAILSNLLE